MGLGERGIESACKTRTVFPFHLFILSLLFFFMNTEETILNKVVEIPRWSNAKLKVIGMHGYITKN